MTYSHARHDSFICVTWLIHICDMTHSHVWHDSFTCVTWLIHMCDMSHSTGRPCHRALHLPLRRLARHHRFNFSKVSSCWIDQEIKRYLHCQIPWLGKYMNLAKDWLGKYNLAKILLPDNADTFWELLASSLLLLSSPVLFFKYVCVYIYSLSLYMHGCLRIIEIWMCICIYIYIYMHGSIGVRADEIEFNKHRQYLCQIHVYLYRVAKTHRMPYLHKSLSAKEPYNEWLFCEKWPAT